MKGEKYSQDTQGFSWLKALSTRMPNKGCKKSTFTIRKDNKRNKFFDFLNQLWIMIDVSSLVISR